MRIKIVGKKEKPLPEYTIEGLVKEAFIGIVVGANRKKYFLTEPICHRNSMRYAFLNHSGLGSSCIDKVDLLADNKEYEMHVFKTAEEMYHWMGEE